LPDPLEVKNMKVRTEIEAKEIPSLGYLYQLYVYDQEGELASMNRGEYCSEVRTLLVTADHTIFARDNDAINESRIVDPDDFGFDRHYPLNPETINNIRKKLEEMM